MTENRLAGLLEAEKKPVNRLAGLDFDEPNVPPVPLIEPIDVYAGINDPQDVEVRARDVLKLARENELPIKTVEKFYDRISGDKEMQWADIISEPVTDEEILEKPFIYKRLWFGLPEPWETYVKQAPTIGEEQAIEQYYKTYPHKRPRQYKNFFDELVRNLGGGVLNVASGFIGTTAVGIEQTWGASEDALLSTENLHKWAQQLHDKAKEPVFAPAEEGGWKGFVAAAVGQAAPYMGAAIGATVVTGTPLSAFGIAFAVEGDNAYRDAIAAGASEEDAQLRRFIVGTINGAIEQMQITQVWKFARAGTGSAKQILKAAERKAWRKLVAKGANFTYEAAKHASREGLEEALQEFTSIVAQSEFEPEVWDNARYRIFSAGLGGGVVGLIYGAGGKVIAGKAQIPSSKRLSAALQEKLNVSKELADMVAAKVDEGMPIAEADKMFSQAKVLGEKSVLAEAEPPTEVVEKPPSKAVQPLKPEIRPAELKKPPTKALAPAKEPWEMTRGEWGKIDSELQKKQIKARESEHPERAFAVGKEISKHHYGIYPKGYPLQLVHEDIIKKAIQQGKPVPREVLEEYKSEKWAQEALAKPAAPTAEKPAEVKVELKRKKIAAPGFVDLTPLAEAGPQVRAAAEKATKAVTRFTGLEPEVRKALIEYEEQLRELPKAIATDSIKKFGKLTKEQERAIENHRENPKKYPDLPDELKPHLETLEEGIDDYGKRLEALGYPADWPNTYVERLEKLLIKEQSRKEPNTDKIEQLEEALEEAKDLRYLHHQYEKAPLGKRIWGRFRRSITKRPRGLLGRKIPTYEKAEELGLKRVPLAVSYAHMVYEIERAEMADQLIKAINENPNLSLPEKQAPEEWVKLDERIFPASVQHAAWITEEGKPAHKRAYRKYPVPIAEALEELTYSRGNEAIERWYDKWNFALKIIGFYNPLVMTKNDAVQLWRAAGIKGAVPLVLPQVEFQSLSIKPPEAVQIWKEKGAEYEKLRKGGLFNNVVNYSPAVKEITQQMLDHIRETSGEKAARIAGQILNPANLVKNIRKYNDMSTWNMDEIIRIACYESVKDSPLLKGMTDFEKIEWVNDAMVNYGKLPKSTKRWIGKALFVPTYRIGNFRFFFGETSRVYKGQWRHMAPILRTAAYKLFIQFGLPAIVGAAIYYATDEERDVYTEKGYRLVIHNPKTNTDTVYALADPLLEGAKLTQRTPRHTLRLNLAPIPSLLYRVMKGPRFKQSRDPFGEFFKIGTPVVRDVVNWTDPDKTVPQKILTQLAIAFVYTRRGRERDKTSATVALAKALSVWTDWKEHAADVKQMISGRSYYLGPGGKFGRLIRQYRMEQDIDRAETDVKVDSLIKKGKDLEAIELMIKSERYETPQGISGRLLSYKAPLYYYWDVMSTKEQVRFMLWLEEEQKYTVQEILELKDALDKSLRGKR